MKGVVYLGDSEVEVRDFSKPEPGLGQVVIQMKVGGLCGSDLHKYHSNREWASERKGMISGHEPAGVVVEVRLGPVGLTALLMGQAMGFNAIGVDVQPYRVGLAERIGKGTVIDASVQDPVEAIRDLTGGKGATGVVECSGNGKARTQAARVAGRKATVVYIGSGQQDLTINVGDLIGKDITIRGNSVYPVGAYYEAVTFLETHTVPLDDIVTHRFKVEDAVEAFNTFDAGETGKVVFEWD